MSGLRSLTSQTLIYGLGTVFLRFLNLFLTPFITYFFAETGNGIVANIYAFIALLNIIYLFGMETSYFKFSQQFEEKKVFNHVFFFLLFTTVLWSLVFLGIKKELSALLDIRNERLLYYIPIIVGLDAISSIIFCRLRYFQQIFWFLGIRIGAVIINLLSLAYFISFMEVGKQSGNSFFLFNTNEGIEYVFIANIFGSAFSFFVLVFKTGKLKFRFNTSLMSRILIYSLPLLFVGMGGMINETLDRILLMKLSQGTYHQRLFTTGVYSASYKLSILITLFIYAFKMGAEPFFFKISKNKDAPEVYAKIMSGFVYVLGIGFLVVMLFLDYWKFFISAQKHEGFNHGLDIVPILLFANIFLGIYYHLSIAYKLKKTTLYGAIVTFIGVTITLLINYFFIPTYGYYASAWATFSCYATMMVIGFLFFRKLYHIPYKYAEIIGMLGSAFALYIFFDWVDTSFSIQPALKITISLSLLVLYASIFYGRIIKRSIKKI